MTKNFEKDTVDVEFQARALSNMKKFTSKNKFQEATIAFIVKNLINKEDHDELMKVFQSIDTNNDG